VPEAAVSNSALRSPFAVIGRRRIGAVRGRASMRARAVGNVLRSTATRALAQRCGGFGSTARTSAGHRLARAIPSRTTERSVAVASPPT
jgi:hypothetical protein